MERSKEKLKFINGNMYKYRLYGLVDEYSSILREKMVPFDFSSPPMDPQELSYSLIETMIQNRGIGLSSNQVGLSYRVFSMGHGELCYCCFNPEILEVEGLDAYMEGCLSFPGLFLNINRPSIIKVRFTTMKGNVIEESFSGLTAKIFQHELDHLDGTVFTSKVSQVKLNMAKKKVKGNLKKLAAQRLQEQEEYENQQRKVEWQNVDKIQIKESTLPEG